MVLIGYIPFYFDLERTSDHAIVVLTSILVIATMGSSIQEVNVIEMFLFPYYLILYQPISQVDSVYPEPQPRTTKNYN